MIPDSPPTSDDRLHIGMVGIDIPGYWPRMQLEAETTIDNKHRKWFLRLNGKPAKNPVIHLPSDGTDNGFVRETILYLYKENYKDVIIHGGNLPERRLSEWTVSNEVFNAYKYNYLMALWDDENPEIKNYIDRAKTPLIVYLRKPLVSIPNPIPPKSDPNYYAAYGKAVKPGSYVGITGSREFKTDLGKKKMYQAVLDLIDNLPADCIVLVGGAKGIDQWAETEARRIGLKVIVHKALWVSLTTPLYPEDRTEEFDNQRSRAGTERNKVIVDESNVVFAFLSANDSPGTTDCYQYAALRDKLAIVFREQDQEPLPQNPKFEILDLFGLYED